ncbi:hypothetical protein HPP92_009838 [Vanilla planifolia]|uniref:Uncharacterized protein n=1 Tax=Vanilla planifolia TaxID=51239 RepID=A0A835RBC1_VANPL|nr:hypothetical protein HPP92_009838 [Vanilla planifolia]
MSAAVRLRAPGRATVVESSSSAVQYLVAHSVHAGRFSDLHALQRRRLEDLCPRFPGHFLSTKLLSLQGELVDRGSLRSSAASAAVSKSSGEPPEIWQQPADSGTAVHSSTLPGLNVIRMGRAVAAVRLLEMAGYWVCKGRLLGRFQPGGQVSDS